MTAPKAATQTYDPPEPAALLRKRGPGLRKTLAGAVLSVAVAGALAAGGWGLVLAQVSPPTPAAGAAVPMGEAAEVPGGLLRVDDVLPERMEHAQTGKFAQSGMNMSGMGVDMVPEGQQRFTVEISLAAGSGGLDYSAGDFRLSGEGVKESAPIRSQLGDGALPAGSETHGGLIFQAPQGARDLTLSFDGGEPVALELEGSGAGSSHASGEGEAGGGGHGH